LIAAAVAYEAVNMWEKKQKEEGNEVQHATAKKLIAGIAAKEVHSIHILCIYIYIYIYICIFIYFFLLI
jgi:uncharacterized membrane protein YebE (DUF533 family)